MLPAAVVLWVLTGCDSATTPEGENNGKATSLPAGWIEQSEQHRPQTLDQFAALLNAPTTPGIGAEVIGIGDNRLLIVDIDPAVQEPVLLAVPEQGISAADSLQQEELSVVVGSGFVSELHSLQPVGLLQLNGTTLSPVQGHGYTRVLGINDSGMGVVHKESYQRDLFHSALQLGPGIIEQGRLDISERDFQRPRYFRSFIAVCEKRWLAGVSLAPSHLRTLGETLVNYFAQQDWQCPDVVNMAGDRQSVLLIRNGNGQILFHGEPDTHKVSLIGFRAKAPATVRK